MKTARALMGCGVLLAAAILGSRADNNAVASPSLPPATTPAPARPAAPAPLPPTGAVVKGISVPTLQSFPVTSENLPPSDPADLGNNDPERIAEQTYLLNLQKQKEEGSIDLDQVTRQRAYDNDWMMRGYAEQMKKQGAGDSKEIDSVLVADPNAPPSGVVRDELLLGQPAPPKKPAQHRASSLLGTSDLLTPKKSLVSSPYQPLIKPFDEGTPGPAQTSAGTAASPFDSGLGDLETSSGATLLPVPGMIPEGAARRDAGAPVENAEASLLDIPGLTAATQGEVAPNNALAFQDPGENETTSRQHPRTSVSNNNNFMLPTTPSNDITDFFKKQADALRPPTAPNSSMALVAPVHPALPLAPAPLTRPAQQAGMGMRLHIDDPFDILRR